MYYYLNDLKTHSLNNSNNVKDNLFLFRIKNTRHKIHKKKFNSNHNFYCNSFFEKIKYNTTQSIFLSICF